MTARITLGRTATTTLGNAEETAEWARMHRLRSLIVVTAGFHMPRALLELRRAMPDTVLYPAPVQPQSGLGPGSLRILAAEYAKLIGAWAGVSHIVRQPLSMVRHPPVDKSVSGYPARCHATAANRRNGFHLHAFRRGPTIPTSSSRRHGPCVNLAYTTVLIEV